MMLESTNKDDHKLLDNLAYTLRGRHVCFTGGIFVYHLEYADHMTSQETAALRQEIIETLNIVVTRHTHIVSKAEELKEKATGESARIAREMKEQSEHDQTNKMRQSRKVRKTRDKIRKMEKELERQEQLEEYRWNRKRGFDL